MRDRQEIYQEAIKKWGMEAQIVVAMEECAELIVALSKSLRNGFAATQEEVIEEMADVQIMLEQMRNIFDYRLHREGEDPKEWPSAFWSTVDYKIWRLDTLLERLKDDPL